MKNKIIKEEFNSYEKLREVIELIFKKVLKIVKEEKYKSIQDYYYISYGLLKEYVNPEYHNYIFGLYLYIHPKKTIDYSGDFIYKEFNARPHGLINLYVPFDENFSLLDKINNVNCLTIFVHEYIHYYDRMFNNKNINSYDNYAKKVLHKYDKDEKEYNKNPNLTNLKKYYNSYYNNDLEYNSMFNEYVVKIENIMKDFMKDENNHKYLNSYDLFLKILLESEEQIMSLFKYYNIFYKKKFIKRFYPTYIKLKQLYL